MTRKDLINALTQRDIQLPKEEIEAAVKALLDYMAEALEQGDRIEIRGFGGFSLHYHPPPHGTQSKNRRRCSRARQVCASF